MLSRGLAIAGMLSLCVACAKSGDQQQGTAPVAVTRGAATVKVTRLDGHYTLTRNGQPYQVHGAGLEHTDIGIFAAHGGNSIRTWRTNDAGAVLDEAAAHGVTVALCIDIARERHGFDYNDDVAVAAQLEFARGEVEKYRNHPALLAWIIGNELNLDFTNPKVFDAANEISRMIHAIDPNHPTSMALAGFDAELATLVATRVPDLDFVSVQMYADIVNLPSKLRAMAYDKPYFVTEWGAVGHWEVEQTSWGAPIEQTSSEKADHYLLSYETAIASDPDHVLGSYVFLWGQKQERTPTWFGMFLPDGSETEVIDVMHFLWNGGWPVNRSPRLQSFLLDSRTAHQNVLLQSGEQYEASVLASDPDGDALTYRFEIMPESDATQTGGDKEVVPPVLPGLLKADRAAALVTAPSASGAYRLFVYVYDGQGHAGHANIPFFVN